MKATLSGASRYALPFALSLFAGLSAQASDNVTPFVTAALQGDVQNIVVIYAENRSFDNVFGNYPGAHGLSEVIDSNGNPLPTYITQKDRDGSVLPTLPQTWTSVTAAGNPQTITTAQSGGLPNAPFHVETAFSAASGVTLTTADVTRDLYHRFFENQMATDGGKNDTFAAWEDAGGLTMGYWDYSHSKIYALAQQYTLADKFFEGAFGGSFLNHQYLVCACAPQYPNANAPATGAHPTIAVLDPTQPLQPFLKLASNSPASALTGPPVFQLSGNIAPLDYFGSGDGYRAVNTMQPPYQPSGNQPVDANGSDLLYAAPAAANTLPPQTQTTIGDQLTTAGVSWKWYSGAWTAAVADGTQIPGAARTVIYTPSTPRAAPDFQAHHQPFNYYAILDPVSHAADRANHLKDYNDLVADAAAGTLPAVAFFKPQGNLNQHPGYANLDDADNHIADLVSKLQASPQWAHMVIVITYDEFGGQWDHFGPPKGDLLGPGTRIPALVISPYARHGYVDHTQYDTASILRLISRRYSLSKLSGLTARDTALVANGGYAMGDLTNALALLPQGPTDLAATIADGAVHLSWTPSANAHGYYVYQGNGESEESYSPVQTLKGANTAGAKITGLTANKNYYFKVAAIQSNGSPSDLSNEASVSLPVPAAPNDLTAASYVGAVKLQWTPVANTNQVNVYAVTQSGQEASAAPYVTLSHASSTSSVRITGLTVGTTYYFKINAVDTAAGTAGPLSNEAVATAR